MIKIRNKSVTLNASKKLTPKQHRRLETLTDPKMRQSYALSILGLSRTRVKFIKPHRESLDKIMSKSKGSVQSLFRDLLNNGDSQSHVPFARSKASRWIGVEIECLFPDDGSSEDCTSCDGSGHNDCYNETCSDGQVTLTDDSDNEYIVDCRTCDGTGQVECGECDGERSSGSGIKEKIKSRLRQEKVTCCSVKNDGSLSGEDMAGVEVTVLLDSQHGFDKLRKVCKILNSLGATVNSTCGLHVHLDQHGATQNESIDLAHKIGNYLPALLKLVPESRRSNTYCKPTVSSLSGCRYHAVNLTALESHGTIEIRLHSGTTDAQKIINWVSILQSIVTTPSPGKMIDSIYDMARILGLSEPLTEYCTTRFLKFCETDKPLTAHDDEESGQELEQEAV